VLLLRDIQLTKDTSNELNDIILKPISLNLSRSVPRPSVCFGVFLH